MPIRFVGREIPSVNVSIAVGVLSEATLQTVDPLALVNLAVLVLHHTDTVLNIVTNFALVVATVVFDDLHVVGAFHRLCIDLLERQREVSLHQLWLRVLTVCIQLVELLIGTSWLIGRFLHAPFVNLLSYDVWIGDIWDLRHHVDHRTPIKQDVLLLNGSLGF